MQEPPVIIIGEARPVALFPGPRSGTELLQSASENPARVEEPWNVEWSVRAPLQHPLSASGPGISYRRD